MVPSEHSAGPRSEGVDGAAEHGREPTTPESDRAHPPELHGLLAADRERTRDLTSIIESGRLTATDDEHAPEGSTTAFERSHTNALLTAAEDHLADVDLALRRIADGEHGRCEHCGGPVSHDRLLARPAARTCIDCATGVSSPRRGRPTNRGR